MDGFTDNVGYITDFGLHFFPDKTALIAHGGSLSYRELDERANRVAHQLRAAGVGTDERVLMLFENDIRFVEVLLGSMRAGAVPVPASTKWLDDRVASVLADCGARVVIASSGFLPSATKLIEAGACDLAVGIGGEAPLVDYESWLRTGRPDRLDIVRSGPDLCMQPYTSGSTGNPKGVLFTHQGWLANLDVLRRVLLLRSDDTALCANPLFHTNALGCGVLPALLAGGSAAVLPAFDPLEVLASIERWRCTFTTGVPAMYKLILNERDELARRDTSSIRFLLCGSAPMPKSLLEELDQALPGAPVIEGYGLTEGGPVISINPRFGERRIGSIGLPLPGVDVRIVASDGSRADPTDAGELWAKNPGNAAGFHNLPEVTARRYTPDGYLRTGDLVRQDEDGFLYFVGRLDEMINVAGEHVYPAEVEAVLIQHPGVRDVAVVPKPHDVKGDVPVAFVVADGVSTIDAGDLRAFFCERAPRHAQPRDVFVVDTLPLAATGKVDRHALAERARQHTEPAAPSDSSGTPSRYELSARRTP